MLCLNMLTLPNTLEMIRRLREIGIGALPLVLIFVTVLLWVLYSRSLERALNRCSAESRTITPEEMWLLLIPVVRTFWHFWAVSGLAASLENEFKKRNLSKTPSQPAKVLGLVMCILPILSAILVGIAVRLSLLTAKEVLIAWLSGIGLALAVAGIVLWIAYWVRIAGYSKLLVKTQPAAEADGTGTKPVRNPVFFAVGVAGLALFLAASLPPATGFLFFVTSGRAMEAADAYAAVYPHWYSRYLFCGEYVSRQQVKQVTLLQVRARYPQYADNPMILHIFEQQVGQQLVEQKVLVMEAERRGLRSTDVEVNTFLHQGQFGAFLYPNGQYIGDDRFAALIEQQFGFSLPEFKQELKQDLTIKKLQDKVTAGVNVSDDAVRAAYRKANTRIKFNYAVIDAGDLLRTINPSESELEAFFQHHAAQYATAAPEQRRITYFAFLPAQLPGGPAQVSPQEIQQFYQKHQAEYSVPEQARSRHILIVVPPGADAQIDAGAKAKAEELLKQIQGGANFADLARKFSDDPGSKQKGGELGFARRGMMVPEFESALFTQKIGETQMVKSQFGYHLVQVEERQAAHTAPLAEVQSSIQSALMRQKMEKAIVDYGQTLAAEAAKNGMEKTAAAHHLALVTSPLLSAQATSLTPQGKSAALSLGANDQDKIAPLPDSSQLITQAFAAKQGDAPQFAACDQGLAVFQVAAIAPAHAPSFADWKSHVAEDYRREQLPILLQQKTEALAAKAKAENDLAKAAKEMGASFHSSELVGAGDQAPEIGRVGQAAPKLFDLNPGELSGAMSTGRAGVVAKLLEKQLPNDQEIAQNFSKTREGLLEQRKAEVFNSFAKPLMDEYQKQGRIVIPKGQEETPNP